MPRRTHRLLGLALPLLPHDFRAAQVEAEAILGMRTDVREDGLALLSTDEALALGGVPRLAVALEWASASGNLPIACLLTHQDGARLVDRVLGGDGRPVLALDESLDDLSLGVVGYLAARLCATTHAALLAREVITERATLAELLGAGQVIAWRLVLELRAMPAIALQMLIPETTARALATRVVPACDPELTLARLPALPLRLCAHAAQIALRKSELDALAVGDVVIPTRCPLIRNGASFAGGAELHVLGARRGAFLLHGRDQQFVVERRASLAWEAAMTDTQRISPSPSSTELAELPVDAPIELCVELARFSLRLDELAALRPGQVLATGKPIGEQVTLSAAGLAIARGELVEIDGEIGVRILEVSRP